MAQSYVKKKIKLQKVLFDSKYNLLERFLI